VSAPLPAEEVASGLFCCWSLRNNNTATNLQSSLEVTVVGVLLHVSVECRHLGSKYSEIATADSGNYPADCAKRSMNESVAMLSQHWKSYCWCECDQ